jgi:nickase/relaxase
MRLRRAILRTSLKSWVFRPHYRARRIKELLTNMLCLKITDAHGKRINPKKSDLNDIRKKFALELNRMNIDATATIRKKSKDWQRWKNY